MKNKLFVLILSAIVCVSTLWAAPASSADSVPDLYSAGLAGSGAYTTSTGGAPVSSINPAQGADATRMIFDAGYLIIPPTNATNYSHSLYAGGLFPTKFGVFGGSLRFIGIDQKEYSYYDIGPTFGGNLFASKEVYPGMSIGLGFNFGFGHSETISGDLGFRYNAGNLGFLKNFTFGAVIGGLGLSYHPTWFTPAAGVSFDIFRIEGKDNKPDPLAFNFKADVSFPGLLYFHKDFEHYVNMIFKFGIDLQIAEIINVTASWPGGSGVNIRHLSNDIPFNPIPAIGLTVNILLPSGGERIAGGRLPSDGDLKISAAYKPLYKDITAIGAGVSWHVGRADTQPPVIKPDYPETLWFSPNNSGKSDALEFPISITDQSFIINWTMEIKDERGNVVRTLENKEQRFESFNLKDFFQRIVKVKNEIDIPDVMRWDGLRNDGTLAPDGLYTFTISATDEHGNKAVTQVYETRIKITPPNITINAMNDSQKIFDPRGTGGNRTVTFNHRGSNEDAWISEIFDASGQKVRTFEPQRGAPGPVVWDGRTDAGQVAPDGVYSYRISATDRAANSASADVSNIILDSRVAGAFLTSSVNAIAPRAGQTANLVDFNIRLLLNDGIESWKLELKDASGVIHRTFTGTSRVPATQGWNGLTEQGQIREGAYTPQLTVEYTRGDTITATATNVIVAVSGPALTFTSTPEYFSPDNDGVDDELFIRLSAQSILPIASWKLEIREPEPPYNVFRTFEGRGSPANQIIWDGKSNRGELVQSAMDYPYTFSAQDTIGNSSSIEGKIGVDVLVIRDGDRLKMQVPSIVFRPNFADFNDLPKDTVDNNTRILRRIAQILNKFRDYRVQVEGHANPTQPAGPARDREQVELQRLSEARARAVVDQLVRYGVARNRLSAIGAGGSSPVVPFEDRDNWWKNRRVEFILIK
ncbi:MAG: OmpA family protein [Treponema sp.]|jgi:flagellar motor protein MotB/flagellar hook assembly protein FlgD|nr:OmpA family protein [Treponema sp.]